MKVRPLSDRIMVKRVDEAEQVKGGIIIPDTAKEKPRRTSAGVFLLVDAKAA